MRAQKQFGSIASLVFLCAVHTGSAWAQSGKKPSKVYELRLYTATAGKLADLQTVFRSQALPLFTKYGIENVLEGTVLEGAPVDGADARSLLVCILAHQSREAADRSWATIEAAAEWQEAMKRAEQNGPLLAKPAVSIFNDSYRLLARAGAAQRECPARVFELRKYNTGPDGLPRTVTQFKSGMAAILSENGMTPIAYWTAYDNSAFIYLLPHKDREAARGILVELHDGLSPVHDGV